MATPRKTSATAAEALGERVPLTFEGVDYLVLPSTEWPYEALEAFEQEKIATFLRLILGEEQHDAFKATKPTVAKLREFIPAIQKALGIAGN